MRLQIEPSLAGLESGQRAMRAFLQGEGVAEREIYLTELVLDELATNVVKYAYAEAAGSPTIDIGADVSAEEVVFTIEDEGPAFNPLDVPEPVLPTSIDDAKAGGVGLLLVRKVAKHVDYERRSGRNRIRVVISRR